MNSNMNTAYNQNQDLFWMLVKRLQDAQKTDFSTLMEIWDDLTRVQEISK